MSNFICEKCGMTNIDCGKQGYKTPREIELEEQNQRLQVELDKQIKDNRKLVKALKEYANKNNWRCDTITGFQSVWQGGIDDEQVGNILAQNVLKEIKEV